MSDAQRVGGARASRRRASRAGLIDRGWLAIRGEIAPFAGLAVAMLALLLYVTTPTATALAFGMAAVPEGVTPEGFYGVERNAVGALRWTAPAATLRLPVAAPGGYRVMLTIQAQRPTQPVAVAINGTPVGTVVLGQNVRSYSFATTLGPRAWAEAGRELRVALATEPFVPPGDPRELGAMVYDASLATTAPLAPADPNLVVPLLALLLIAYVALRRLGLGRGWAATGLGGALALFALRAATDRGAALAVAYQPVIRPTFGFGAALGGAAVAGLAGLGAGRRAVPAGIGARAGRLAGLALAVAPTAAIVALGYERRWVTDDGFIYFRIVQNVLAGHGPVFNAGERVEAGTGPLWVGLLALWGALGGRLEVGAVGTGLLFSGLGLIAAQAGARALWAALGAAGAAPVGGVRLPLGALALAALPPIWDFATSGLETGLVFGWLGGTFWATARLALGDRPGRRAAGLPPARWLLAAALGGLGPLIRPDLAVFSAAFLGALGAAWALGRPWCGAGGGLIWLALAAAILPGGYQVFRMGYFAALVPTPALAKEAGDAYWSQGWAYVRDLGGTYLLLLPLIPLLGWLGLAAGRAAARRAVRPLLVIAAPLAGAALHAFYVVRVGGDYFHARLLLPSLFAALLPLAEVALPAGNPARPARAFLLVGPPVLVWALASALFLRVPYPAQAGPDGIEDNRGFWARIAENPNPVLAEDLDRTVFGQEGNVLRRWAETQGAGGGPPRALFVDRQPFCPNVSVRRAADCETPLPQPLEYPPAAFVPAEYTLVAVRKNTGITGYNAGPRVFVVDRHGLSDPLAARLRLTVRRKLGHEKALLNPWIVARFAAPPAGADDPAVAAARRALACGELAELDRAVTAPLTPALFLSNLRHAWAFHQLRLPEDPEEAVGAFCGG